MRFRCRPRDLIVAAVAAVIAMSALGGPASAGEPSPSASPDTVTITDGSHVLSQQDLGTLHADGPAIVPESGGTEPPDPVWIYTTTGPKDGDAFDRYYMGLRGSAPSNVIIVAVNTKARHIIITSGSSSGLSDSGADHARERFTESFRNGSNYGSALDSTLRDLSTSVMAGPFATFPATNGAHHGGNGHFLIYVVVLVAIFTIVLAIRAKAGGGRYYGHSGYGSFHNTGSGGFGGGSSGGGGSGGSGGGGTSSGSF